MRLRTRFAIALALTTLVVSGVVYAGNEFYERQATEEVQSNVDETAIVAASQIDNTIRERRDYVGLVASRPEAAQFNRSDAFIGSFLSNSRFYAAQIVAANGTVVHYQGTIQGELFGRDAVGSKTNATYVKRALRGESQVSGAYPIEGGDRYVVVFSAPIFEGDEVKGAMVAATYINQRTVFDALSALETSARTVRVEGTNGTLYPGQRNFSDAIQGDARVRTTGWRVVVSQDRSGLVQRLEGLALFQFSGLALILIAMIGFGYWQYATNLQQTQDLLEGFGELKEGNFGYSLSLGGGTEWVRIGDGFEDLADGLARREEELRERGQRIQVLQRVLRHNLRNELTVVLSYADMIAATAEDETTADAASAIRASATDLRTLTERAGELRTAMEADAEPGPVDVERVVEGVVAGLDYPDVEKSVTVEGDPTAQGVDTLHMAVENVCENACKHNDADDPRMDVTIREHPEGVRLEVTDNGPGIPDQDRAAIESGEETDLEHGSGLGLWVVYWIVEDCGGDLELSVHEPRGSTVRIDLPPAETVDEDGDEEKGARRPAENVAR